MEISDKQYLTLSQLSYQDLEKYKGSTIGDIIQDKINNKEYVDSNWLDNYKAVSDFTLINFENNDGLTGSGFAGCAFKNMSSGETVFAFRGTEPNTTEQILHDVILTDGSIAFGTSMPQQMEDAREFVETTLMPSGAIVNPGDNVLELAVKNNNVSFTGHSFGGGLAQYLEYLTDGSGTSKAVTFNAVGIGQLLEPEASFGEQRVTDYHDSNDLIGAWGVQLGKTVNILNTLGISMSHTHSLEVFFNDIDSEGNITQNIVPNDEVIPVNLLSDAFSIKSLMDGIAAEGLNVKTIMELATSNNEIIKLAWKATNFIERLENYGGSIIDDLNLT